MSSYFFYHFFMKLKSSLHHNIITMILLGSLVIIYFWILTNKIYESLSHTTVLLYLLGSLNFWALIDKTILQQCLIYIIIKADYVTHSVKIGKWGFCTSSHHLILRHMIKNDLLSLSHRFHVLKTVSNFFCFILNQKWG